MVIDTASAPHRAIHDAVGPHRPIASVADADIGYTRHPLQVVATVTLTTGVATVNWAGRPGIKLTMAALTDVG